MSRPAQASAQITAEPGAVICQDTDIRGSVTIGAGTVVHVKAVIMAVEGPIVIGKDCLIEETAVIVNRKRETMVIGDENHFQVGCRVESPSVGDSNVFQTGSKVSSAVRVTDNCTIGSGAFVPAAPEVTEETLPPYTVIYGTSAIRRTCDQDGESAERTLRTKHIVYLREVLPKYQRLRAL